MSGLQLYPKLNQIFILQIYSTAAHKLICLEYYDLYMIQPSHDFYNLMLVISIQVKLPKAF